MFYLFFLIAVMLSLGLFFSVIKTGPLLRWSKAFRIVMVALSVLIFTYLFFQKSIDQFQKNALTIQVINKLPFPLDFYLIKINKDVDPELKFETTHVGIIRNDFYRIDYLQMTNSDEYWLVGYMGNKSLAYFTQHSVPNKNQDQIIEVQNYIVQSNKLSKVAKSQIDDLKFNNIKSAIWMTLDLLLLFLNIALLLRKEKVKMPKTILSL